jgi:hypothetical protein
MSHPASNTRSHKRVHKSSAARPGVPTSDVEVKDVRFPCPFADCEKGYTAVSSLKWHLLVIRGGMQDDRLHPRDSPVWEHAAAQGWLVALPRGDGVTEEERKERRKHSQAQHYKTNKQTILKKQGERLQKTRAALEAAKKLASIMIDGMDGVQDGGSAPITTELFDRESLNVESYLRLNEERTPQLEDFCHWVLWFLPPDEWPKGTPLVEGKLAVPPSIIDCIPNSTHYRKIALLVHPDKRTQLGATASSPTTSDPIATHTALEAVYEPWKNIITTPGNKDVKMFDMAHKQTFAKEHRDLWDCWAAYQREKENAGRRFLPTKSGHVIAQVAAGNVQSGLRIGPQEAELLKEIASAGVGGKRKRGKRG